MPFSSALLSSLPAAQDPGGDAIGGTTGAVIFLGLVLGLLMSVLIFFGRGRSHRRRQAELQEVFDGDVRQGLALLEQQLDGVPAGAARSDAADRLGAARQLLANGGGVPVLRAARHTLLEGLAAAQAARCAAGLSVGAPPPDPNDAPMTTEPVAVVVAGRSYCAYPEYRPGAVHHFAGGMLAGTEVPGGWYREPFWESLLLGEDSQNGIPPMRRDVLPGTQRSG